MYRTCEYWGWTECSDPRVPVQTERGSWMLLFLFCAFSCLFTWLVSQANLESSGTFPFFKSLLALAPHVVRHQSPFILRRIWAVDLSWGIELLLSVIKFLKDWFSLPGYNKLKFWLYVKNYIVFSILSS